MKTKAGAGSKPLQLDISVVNIAVTGVTRDSSDFDKARVPVFNPREQ